MICTAANMIQLAYANGYAKLSERDLLAAAVAATCAASNAGSSQIVPYTGANPNADGVKPGNTQAAAIAVKPASTTWTWSVAGQTWT